MTHHHTKETKAAEGLADFIEQSGLEPRALPDEYSYASLPLCVIDAVFSIGVTYTATWNTVVRFCDHVGWKRVLSAGETRVTGQYTIADFLELLENFSPDQMADDLYGNRQRTSSRSGILKAEAVRRFAVALSEAGIDDFVHLTDDALEIARETVRTIPGQRSGISFDYFQMLAGDDDLIKPDRMVQRYIAFAISETPQSVTPDRARGLLQNATKSLVRRGHSWSPRRLDHAIWKLESARSQEARYLA